MPNFFRQNKAEFRRVVVLGLDGMPHSLLHRLIADGVMPNFQGLIAQGALMSMTSVVPTVSSTAWASIATGCNPGKHGIFGFIDRVPQTHEMFIPSSRTLKAETWVDLFSGMGRRVFSMGVPTTFPPRPVNGILISGFLAPALNGATYPASVASELASLGYLIDIDAWQARENREKFLDEIFYALDRRAEAMFRYYAREAWDLFIAHFMGRERTGGWVERMGTHSSSAFIRSFLLSLQKPCLASVAGLAGCGFARLDIQQAIRELLHHHARGNLVGCGRDWIEAAIAPSHMAVVARLDP